MTEEEFWAALAPLPEPPPVLYRLYYGEHGEPLFYSMEDLPGKYIDVTKEEFFNTPTYSRVVDGKLKVFNNGIVTKLYPGDAGTPCHPNNVSIVVKESQPYTKWILK